MNAEQVLLSLAVVATAAAAVLVPRLWKNKETVMTAQAQVLSRCGQMPTASLPNNWGGRMDYTVTFATESETLTLQVTSSQFTHLVEGTKGTLTWQDKTLLQFEPVE